MIAVDLAAEREAWRKRNRAIGAQNSRTAPIANVPAPAPAPGMVSLAKLAQRAGVTRRSLLYTIARGELRAVKVRTRRNWRWEVDPAEAARWLAEVAK